MMIQPPTNIQEVDELLNKCKEILNTTSLKKIAQKIGIGDSTIYRSRNSGKLSWRITVKLNQLIKEYEESKIIQVKTDLSNYTLDELTNEFEKRGWSIHIKRKSQSDT